MQKKTNQPTNNFTKDTIARKHFGDLRAKLEIAIDKVLNLAKLLPNRSNLEEENSPSVIGSDLDEIDADDYQNTLLMAVRHDLAPALRALMEHGLYEAKYSNSLAVWGCFASRSNYSTNLDEMHAWKLFLNYYEMKHGDEFANSPARKLSQSFALEVVGGKPITVKQCLLSAVDTIVKLHEKHAQSMESCFKSFVCSALNERKLVQYLRVLLKTTPLIESSYQSWSYTKTTGFNDALHSLDRLSSINFHLPVNVSVRRFLNNRDLIE